MGTQHVLGEHKAEVSGGERFEFGANWARFLRTLTPQRIAIAERSLQSMLGVQHLQGQKFLDIGSGSGLFSLAARRLGARVHSFDYDPESVRCTRELRRRYFDGDPDWTVEEGSVLDPKYLNGLGQFDVVYSWGVLHHTGAMWKALAYVVPLVAPGGKLFIALYNDHGWQSRAWLAIKRSYNSLPRMLRPAFAVAILGPREVLYLLSATLQGRPGRYFAYRRRYAQESLRGMSYWHDLIDWIGGYPYEVAKPDQVFAFCRDRGFRLTELRTSTGCNQFVFEKETAGGSMSS